MQKRFIPPLSNCCMCMDPLLTGFYRVSQKVSDVIPVLRLTPRATQPSPISVFLSVAKCGRVCRAHTCAHSGIELSTLAKGFPQGGPKVRKNFEFQNISSLYLKIEAYKQRMQLYDHPCRNPVKSMPRGKAIQNANGGFVSVLLTHLFELDLINSKL